MCSSFGLKLPHRDSEADEIRIENEEGAILIPGRITMPNPFNKRLPEHKVLWLKFSGARGLSGLSIGPVVAMSREEDGLYVAEKSPCYVKLNFYKEFHCDLFDENIIVNEGLHSGFIIGMDNVPSFKAMRFNVSDGDLLHWDISAFFYSASDASSHDFVSIKADVGTGAVRASGIFLSGAAGPQVNRIKNYFVGATGGLFARGRLSVLDVSEYYSGRGCSMLNVGIYDHGIIISPAQPRCNEVGFFVDSPRYPEIYFSACAIGLKRTGPFQRQAVFCDDIGNISYLSGRAALDNGGFPRQPITYVNVEICYDESGLHMVLSGKFGEYFRDSLGSWTEPPASGFDISFDLSWAALIARGVVTGEQKRQLLSGEADQQRCV